MPDKFPGNLLSKLHIDGRDLAVFLLSLLLAFGIWLVHNLTLRYSDIMNVTIVAESNIEGRSDVSANSAVISARCRASGFRLLRANRHSDNEITVFFPPDEFVRGEDDVFTLSANTLASYIPEIFGEDVQLESFVTKSAVFHFPAEDYRKVPVSPRLSVSYRPQYTSVGEMQFSPDSVIVYGEEKYLESIERVFTKPLELNLIKNDVHGEVQLDIPPAVRISDQKVSYSMEVTRFVEVKADVRMGVKNIPSGKTLSVYPSTAQVVFKCIFPMSSDPAQKASFYIDYQDFENSISGRCVARCSGLPASVISYTIEPEVFECVEEK